MAKIEVAVWVSDNPLHLVGPSMAKIEVAVWVSCGFRKLNKHVDVGSKF